MILTNPYDSHVHWLWTGEMQAVLSLHGLTSTNDLAKISVKKENFRGDWLMGFGWDQNKFTENKFPTRQDLDKYFPNFPVIFTRIDGHAIWVNTVALKQCGVSANTPDVDGGEILRDSTGEPTGIFIDLAYKLIQNRLPEHTADEIKKYLVTGMEFFNRAGITHIRDLSCDELQWNVEEKMDSNGELTLAIERFFSAFDPSQFNSALELAIRARKSSTKKIRVKGIKIFYDGAIGSEGALLSQPYLTRPHHHGLKLLEQNVLEEILTKTWEHKFEIAIHVIGDQAAYDVVKIVTDLKTRGHSGKLNLEHGELLNMDTMGLMKGLDVSCHIQPSHWLTDKEWLNKKVGGLYRLAFPWRALEDRCIHFDFGSDSPIEPPSFFRTLQAMQDAAANGIASTKRDPLSYHQHPDSEWIKGCSTVLEDGRVMKTVFENKVVYQDK